MHMFALDMCKYAHVNWDDLRILSVLAREGSLSRAAVILGVNHTTVARRVSSMEKDLRVRLFVRAASGYFLTREAEMLVEPLRQVEEAVGGFERCVHAHHSGLAGVVRVTSPETLGIAYLASRLARFGREHTGLRIDLRPSGKVLDLGRREAEIAVRTFRTKSDRVAVRRAGEVGYGLYASEKYLARRPVRGRADLSTHPLLLPTDGMELAWIRELVPEYEPAFTCEVSLGLVEAALADAGIAALPRYLGDATTGLRHVPMLKEPAETLWLTVHRDLRESPKVRAVLDFLVSTFRTDRHLLLGG